MSFADFSVDLRLLLALLCLEGFRGPFGCLDVNVGPDSQRD